MRGFEFWSERNCNRECMAIATFRATSSLGMWMLKGTFCVEKPCMFLALHMALLDACLFMQSNLGLLYLQSTLCLRVLLTTSISLSFFSCNWSVRDLLALEKLERNKTLSIALWLPIFLGEMLHWFSNESPSEIAHVIHVYYLQSRHVVGLRSQQQIWRHKRWPTQGILWGTHIFLEVDSPHRAKAKNCSPNPQKFIFSNPSYQKDQNCLELLFLTTSSDKG